MAKSKTPEKNPENPFPRISPEYQADIPHLIEKHDRASQLVPADPSYSFFLGLPEIPLMWEICEYQRPSSATARNKDQEPRSKPLSSTPLPGNRSEAWTKIERESFVLGLYIFEKNLDLVKRFVGTKKMGDVLCFYYGKFYNSEAYRKWSECLKSGRDRFYGKKLFTRWKHENLLARLFALVGKDFQDTLIENSINFSNGRISFKDYVFILKDTVGISVLLKAFCIGQGEKDLTITVREPSNRAVIASSVDSETPFGKAYSSLTPSEIVKILKGNSRLRESQSRDLFMKAVWPRLLAQGWHSEQVKDHKALGLKDSTVFLINTKQKFSRKLVKGKHYFDSVSAILNEVASQPLILGPTAKWDERSGMSNCARAAMKFTVMDASLSDETKPLHKMSGLRTLPSRVLNSTKTHETEELGASKLAENNIKNGTCFDLQKSETSMPNGNECVRVTENDHDSLQIVLFVDKNHQSSSLSTSLVRVRQRSENMNHEKLSSKIENKGVEKDMEAQKCSDRCNEVIIVDNPRDEELDSAESSSQKFLFDLNLPYAPSDSEDDVRMAADKEDSREREDLFDLNIPYVPSDSETDHYTDTAMRQENGDSAMNRPPLTSEEMIPKQSATTCSDDQPMVDGRRQSARSRPMTKRALEALELKLVSSKRRKK